MREVGIGVAAGGAEMAAGAAGGGEDADDAGSGVAAGGARGGANADDIPGYQQSAAESHA